MVCLAPEETVVCLAVLVVSVRLVELDPLGPPDLAAPLATLACLV